MIDGSEKRKHQLVFELQSSHVYKKRSNRQTGAFSSRGKALCTSVLRLICTFHTFTVLKSRLGRPSLLDFRGFKIFDFGIFWGREFLASTFLGSLI